MASERVGFIGIGTMGRHMSRHVVQAGWSTLVYDIAPAGVAEVVAAGARQAGSPKEIAENSDVVITMLPSSPNVEAVLCGADGVLAHMKAGQTVIDMSTIDPLVSRGLHEQAEARGIGMLDAPVSGGSRGARDASLTVMVGGSEELLERFRPLLSAMGVNVIHCGGPGMGEVVKVCNNLISGVNTAAVAEAYALGVRAGADPRVMYDVISKSTGSSYSHNMRPPVKGINPDGPIDTDYAPGFAVDLMHKDLGLALSAGQALKVPLVITAAAQQVYGVARAKGYGRKDVAAVKFGVEAMCGDPETPSSR